MADPKEKTEKEEPPKNKEKDKDHGGHDRGSGGAAPKTAKVRLFRSGTRSRTTLSVKVDGKVPKDTAATFWIGSKLEGDKGNPFIKRLVDDRHTAVGGILIDPADGIGKIAGPDGIKKAPEFNMTDAPKDCTHAIAVVQGENSNQVEIPAEDTPAQAPAIEKPLDIQVISPPRYPDPNTKLFLVQVVTRKDGARADRKFTATSSPTLAEFKQQTAAGLVGVTDFNPTADGSGTYNVFVGFPGRMTQVIFTLDDGQQASVWLRKRA